MTYLTDVPKVIECNFADMRITMLDYERGVKVHIEVAHYITGSNVESSIFSKGGVDFVWKIINSVFVALSAMTRLLLRDASL